MTKYLFGASVQGIQSFIFKTNKLKEIIGASEMIEHICSDLFYNAAKIKPNDHNLILSAAGNIKYIFKNEQDCKDLVKIFPKAVMEYAPGITLNQAVVKIDREDYSQALQTLEVLLKAQRNKVPLTTEIGFIGIERSRRTGGVAHNYSKNEAIDEATFNKLKAAENAHLFEKMTGLNPKTSELSFDTEDITKSGKNSWIAVIHADGNGLGKIIQIKGQELAQTGKFADFSRAIENATKNAARTAFDQVVLINHIPGCRYPIRPIVIGGDDLTIIIRADLAFDFTQAFLHHFERQSENLFEELKLKGFEQGLTACAGIAYIKESYPLHYGLHLAEELCADAKKTVKASNADGLLIDPKYSQMPKSALSLYKVQESFIDDFNTLRDRTLITPSKLSYYAGPYLLEKAKILSDKLVTIKKEAEQSDKSKAVGKIRQIISETYKDKSTAIFMMERMKEVNKTFYNDLNLNEELIAIKDNSKSQLLDLITLHSFNYGNKAN